MILLLLYFRGEYCYSHRPLCYIEVHRSQLTTHNLVCPIPSNGVIILSEAEKKREKSTHTNRQDHLLMVSVALSLFLMGYQVLNISTSPLSHSQKLCSLKGSKNPLQEKMLFLALTI